MLDPGSRHTIDLVPELRVSYSEARRSGGHVHRLVLHTWSGVRRSGARGAVLAMIAVATCRSDSGHSCAQDMAAHDWTSALERCEAEYARSKDLARAVDAATAAFYLDRLDDVVRLANLALTGATSADAHYLLGSAALRRGDHSAAISHLETAVKLHGEIGAARAESRDYHQLAGTRYQLGEYQAAQRAEVAGRDAAERAHDLRMMVYLDIARADIQRRIGDLPGAEASIERALREASVPDDRATALLKRGALHLDQNHPGLARDPLVQALAIEQAGSKREDILQALHLDLAYVERKAKAFARALDEIEQARVAGTDAMSYHLNRGLVYADMGRLDDANTDFVAAETERLDGTWAWWAPFQRAQVAARQGTLETAIAEDLRAIKQVARLASNAGALGPTVIASHREPYLHLLGLFARQEQWNAVLDVVAAMDSRLLLASREQATDPAPGGDLAAPMRAQGAAIVAGAGLRAVAAWQGRPLAIVVPGGDQILRIDVRDGAVTGTDINT
ncbi:MAG TPA: hypothetical protein VIX73_04610, partial [Kofleriaceae bacterium]